MCSDLTHVNEESKASGIKDMGEILPETPEGFNTFCEVRKSVQSSNQEINRYEIQ